MDQSLQGTFGKYFMIGGFVLAILGIFVFSISKFGNSGKDSNLTGVVKIWGTLPASQIDPVLTEYSQTSKTYSVQYTEISESKIADKFIEALATDAAPDLLFSSESVLVPLKQFQYAFPEALMSEKSFKSLYPRSTYKLYGKTGVFAFPVAIDPLVMYVNLDILGNAGYSKPPGTWGEMPLYVSRVLGFVNQTTDSVQRAVALGSLNNILHGREILLTLLFQLKNDVIVRDFAEKTNKEGTTYEESFTPVLGDANENLKVKNDTLAEQVFVFFTSFVNPNIKDAYTWSKKAPMDRDLFASGNLGLYFGLASDKSYIDQKNPHLNYELALIPGPKGGVTSDFRNTAYAKVYSVAMTSKARNPTLAQKVLQDISSKEIANKIVAAYNLAPAREEDLLVEQTDPVKDVIYRSAERGDILMEPISNLINKVFGQIIEAISGSRQTPSEIIKNAQDELSRQLK